MILYTNIYSFLKYIFYKYKLIIINLLSLIFYLSISCIKYYILFMLFPVLCNCIL